MGESVGTHSIHLLLCGAGSTGSRCHGRVEWLPSVQQQNDSPRYCSIRALPNSRNPHQLCWLFLIYADHLLGLRGNLSCGRECSGVECQCRHSYGKGFQIQGSWELLSPWCSGEVNGAVSSKQLNTLNGRKNVQFNTYIKVELDVLAPNPTNMVIMSGCRTSDEDYLIENVYNGSSDVQLCCMILFVMLH